MIVSGFRASSRCRLSLSLYYSLGSFQRRLYAPHSPLHRYREMAEMTRRRVHGNGDSANKAKSPTTGGTVGEREERHDHHHNGPSSNTSQPHTHTHAHSHSHGIFGGHSHSHGHDGYDGGLIETLQSGGESRFATHGPICVYFTMAYTLSSLSFSLSSSFIVVKVTEEVALRLLDWSRMFS